MAKGILSLVTLCTFEEPCHQVGMGLAVGHLAFTR